jgi:hypothetical protein
MSGFDPQLLAMAGIEETLYDFPLPLCTKMQMTPYVDNGLQMYHAQARPFSEIALSRLIFQIVDTRKFYR